MQRESLAGTHYRYRQLIDGVAVIGGEVNVTIRRDGTRDEVRHLAVPPSGPRIRSVASGDLAWVNVNGVARLALREVRPEVLLYRDIDSGAVLHEQPLVLSSKAAAVFDPNPVVKLNAPELRDESDSAAAVPPAAYSMVELQGTRDAGPLGGPWVQIAELQAPAVAPVDASQPLLFDREHSGFEDVNAYFHVDRSQRWLQSLGYVGPRAVVPYAIPTDTHAAGGADNSFFVAAAIGPGTGRLHFGEGGTDDAEDSDLVVHEYAHAIHEWIAPGTFLAPVRSVPRAISEGFGDYWALSAKYAAAVASGRDPFCFADWDARCWTDPPSEQCAYPAGSECLRRLDSTKTVADFIDDITPGTEHRNGEIWSSALGEVFVALSHRYGVDEGRRIADTLIVESLFGTPPNPSFATMARQLMAAERALTAGANDDVICAAMMRRGILDDCLVVPRGELAWFPGIGSGVAVPDNDPAGITLSSFIHDGRAIGDLMVSVDIRHSGRGELRVSLIGPDGTTVRLVTNSPDRAADLTTTFGREAVPIDSLDIFRGRSAAGEWRLHVADVAFGDVATIVSWSVIIRFEGDEPLEARPVSPGSRRFIPVAGHAPGANGTFFRTDLQLLNPRSVTAEAMLIFTPTASDGRVDFAAARVILEAGESVTFADVVRTLFASGGLGQIEIAGDVIASSRTWTPAEAGTFGLFAASMAADEAIGPGELNVSHLAADERFRVNIGFAEVTGAPVTVVVNDRLLHVPPWGHVQEWLGSASRIVIGGEGKVLAYGAIVDNRSGDPILIPLGSRPQSAGRIPAISAPGVAGTFWRTSLGVTPPEELRYVTTGGAVVRQLDVAAVDDVVASLFEAPGTMGTLIANAPREIVARVWTDGPEGTYGLYAPFREPSSAPVQHILHVERSAAFRTNFGFLSDVESRVRLTVIGSDGSVVSVSEHRVQPDLVIQFALTEPVVNGRARVDVLSGRVYAYGALVDNITGDPILVPAVAP